MEITGPVAIIGDIHGDANKLSAMLTATKGRKRIFVGDYVNRGNESSKVLSLLCSVSVEDQNAVFLMGNHDNAFLRYLEGDLEFFQFAMLGGIATIKSYLSRAKHDPRRELLDVFPHEHRHFLMSCQSHFETEDLLVSHCGINPAHMSSRSETDMFLEGHEDLLTMETVPPKLIVCGHYLQNRGKPLLKERLICLDTGCGTNCGPLTSLLLPELTMIQV